jgi:hypothetical protein
MKTKTDQLRQIVKHINSDNKNIIEEFYSVLLQLIYQDQQPNKTHEAVKKEIPHHVKGEIREGQELDLPPQKEGKGKSIEEEEKTYQEKHTLYKEKLLDPVFLKLITTNFNRMSVPEQWCLFALLSKELIANSAKNDGIKEIDKEQINKFILLALQITYKKIFNSHTTNAESSVNQENLPDKQENIDQLKRNDTLELALAAKDSNGILELIIIGSCISEFLKNLTDKEQAKHQEFIDNLFNIKSPIAFYQKIIILIQEMFSRKLNNFNNFELLFLKYFYQPLKYVFNLSEDEYEALCKNDGMNVTHQEHSELKVKIIGLQLLKDLYPHRNSYLKVISEAIKQCLTLEDYLTFAQQQINYIIQKRSRIHKKEDKIVLHYCYQIINSIKVENEYILLRVQVDNAPANDEPMEIDLESPISETKITQEKTTQTIDSLKTLYNKKLINLLKLRVELDIKKTKNQIAKSPKATAILLKELYAKKNELLAILLAAEKSNDLTSLAWCEKYVDKLEEILNFIESKNKHKKSTLDTVSISLLSAGQPLYRYKNKFLNQLLLINNFYNGNSGNKLNPYRLDNTPPSSFTNNENSQHTDFFNYLRLAEIRQLAVFRLNKYMYDRARSSTYLTFDLQNDNPSDQVSKQARFATAITSINLLLNDYDYKKQTLDTFLFKLSEQINNIPHTHSRLKRELRTIVYQIGEDLNCHKNRKDITISNSKKIINQFVFNPSLIENLTSSTDLESYHRERFSFSWKNDVFSPSLSIFGKGLNYIKDFFQTEDYMKETKNQYQIICLLKQFLENDYGFYHDRGEQAEFYTIYMELCSVALAQISDPALKKNIHKNMEMIFDHFVKQKNNGIVFSSDQQYRINIGILRNSHPESLEKIPNALLIKEGQDYRYHIHKEKIATLHKETTHQTATQIFENILTTILVEHFDAEKVLNSGKIARTLTPVNMLNLSLKSVGTMANSQLPGAGAALTTIAIGSDLNELAKAKEVSQNVSNLASTNLEVDELCKLIAKELTFMYEDQIKKLDSREILPFARCAADRVMEEAAKSKRKPNESPDNNSLIHAVRNSSKRHRWMGLKKAALLPSNKNNDYITAEDLFSKPAVMVIDEFGAPRFYINHNANKDDIQRYGIILMSTIPTNMLQISKSQLTDYGAQNGQYDEFINQVLKRVLPEKTKIEENSATQEANEVAAIRDGKLASLSEHCQKLTTENEQLKNQIAKIESDHNELTKSLAEFNTVQHHPKPEEKKLEKENKHLKTELLNRDEKIVKLEGKIDALIHVLTNAQIINSGELNSLLATQPDSSNPDTKTDPIHENKIYS